VFKDLIQDIEIEEILESYDLEQDYYIWYQLNGLPFNNAYILYDDIEDFIKADAVSEEIGGVLDAYIRAFTSGDMDYHITAEDVMGIAKNIRPELNGLFENQLTNKDIETLAMTLDDILDFSALSVGGVMDDFGIDMPVPHFLVSKVMLWIIGIICTGLLFLIAFLRRGYLPDAFLAAGIPVAAAGVIAFIAGIWLDALTDTLSTTVSSLAIHLDGPAYHMMQYGFVFAAAGVLVIAISLMVSSLSKKAQDLN